MNYEGRIVRNRHGRARYRVICRDWFGSYILQSCISRSRMLLVEPRHMDEDWEVVK